MDRKYSKETSIKFEPNTANITDTLKKPRSCREILGRSSKKPVSTPTMRSPSSQPRFLGSCEGMDGQIFDIGPTQADKYIKTKKDLVGYVCRTYSKLPKNYIETLTYKFTSIVGPIMPTKKVTDLATNVEKSVDKLEADLTHL